MNWAEKLKEYTPINWDNIYYGHGANGGRGVGEWLTPQAQAAQAVEAYAEGMATPQQVEAAIDTAAAVEQEKTRNALLNVGLPLTLAVGLFIFFFKDKKK